MKEKIKYAIKEYFKSRFENRDDVQLDAWDMVDISADVQNVVDHANVWNLINPDDESTFPDDDRFVLVSFENFSVPQICRYHRDEDGGAFYLGDDYLEENGKSLSQYGVVVNAWMELPKCYKEIE
jgi:hypothetical protein